MDKHNVVMILLDGLRADRLNLCPNLLGTLKKGYFFSNMITAAPYTLASMNSIFSGLYPTKNGVDSYFNMGKFKKDVCKTLPQYLNDDGYYTCGDLLRKFLVPSQGFDNLSAHDEYKDDLTKLHKEMIRKAAGNNKPFFLFLQYSSLHAENIKNVAKKYDDFSEEYFQNYKINRQRYNSYLKKADLYIKEIMAYIKNSGLLGNTILIVFSDHGISNGEKIGEKIYGSFTYDYTIRVFCSFIVPDAENREIAYQVRTIDIMPTLLEMLNIEPDESYEHLQGKSLMPMMEKKEKEHRIAFSETGGLNGPWPSHHEHNVFCIRLPKWKLIYNKTPGTYELYDLEKDPGEKNNIFDKKKSLASELKGILLNHIKLNQKSNI